MRDIYDFIKEHKSERCFTRFNPNSAAHRADLLQRYLAGLIFVHFGADGKLDGLGLVSPRPALKGAFYIEELIADNRLARKELIKDFLATHPDAWIVGYRRNGKTRSVETFDQGRKLITRMISYGR